MASVAISAAFRLVEGQASEERVSPASAAGLQPDPSRQVSLVTMVFDKLMDGRQLSQQAALDFLANNMEANVWVSVWTIDQRLYLRQEFTQDRACAAPGGHECDRHDIGRGSVAVRRSHRAGAALAASHPRSPQAFNRVRWRLAAGAGGADPTRDWRRQREAQMAAVVAGILRFTSSIQRQQQGQSSLYPLLGLVKEQHRLSGRKTLLYFSEGLVVPKNLEEVFKTAISEANRANVTVYSVDARGLSSARDSDATRDQLLQAARTSQQQMAKRGSGAVSVDEVMIAENAEESLRANVQESLERAGAKHRRLPHRQHQRLQAVDGARRHRHRQLLRGGVRAGRAGARRQVPQDRREGHAPGRDRPEPLGLLRAAARRGLGAAAVRDAAADRAHG